MKYFDTVKLENIQVEVGGIISHFIAEVLINAEGENYYDFQKTITTKYTCAIRADSGRVRYVSEDASAVAPGVGERAFGIDELPADFFDFEFSYWMFDGESFTAWQPTQEELISAAAVKKSQLIATASQVITPFQDALDTGSATSVQKKLLLKWKAYRLAVSQIDVTLAPNIVWPAQP